MNKQVLEIKKEGCLIGEILIDGYCMEKTTKKEMLSELDDYLMNWNDGRNDPFGRAFHIVYSDGKSKYIHDQDYTGEKIDRRNIQSVKMFCSEANLFWRKK